MTTSKLTAYDLSAVVRAGAVRWPNLERHAVHKVDGEPQDGIVPFAVYVQHREGERVLGRYPAGDEDAASLAAIQALDKLNLLIDVKAGQRVAVTKHRQRRVLRKLAILAKNNPPPAGEQPMFRMDDAPVRIAMPSAADLAPNPVALAAKMRMAGL